MARNRRESRRSDCWTRPNHLEHQEGSMQETRLAAPGIDVCLRHQGKGQVLTRHLRSIELRSPASPSPDTSPAPDTNAPVDLPALREGVVTPGGSHLTWCPPGATPHSFCATREKCEGGRAGGAWDDWVGVMTLSQNVGGRRGLRLARGSCASGVIPIVL